MKAKFHPDSHILVEYAAGSLPMAKATMISVHLEHCSHCRQRVRQLESLGAQLMQDIEPTTADQDTHSAWQETLRLIQMPAQPPAKPVHRSIMDKLFPAGIHGQSWQGFGPVKTAALKHLDDDLQQLSLLKIKAGARVPVHNHHGEEWTLVLQGGFSDNFGNYHAGDLVLRHDHDHHSPVAAANEDCICLTYVEDSLKFKGPLGPLYSLMSRL